MTDQNSPGQPEPAAPAPQPAEAPPPAQAPPGQVPPPQAPFTQAPPAAAPAPLAAPVPPATPGDAPVPPAAPSPIPQQTFGAAPAGEGTFGAAPTAPPPPPGEGFPGAEGFPGTAAPVPPAKSKSGVIKIVSIVGVIVLALCVAGGAFLVRRALNTSTTEQAKVGDCIGNAPEVKEGEDKQADSAKVVDCGTADALYKVEGRLDDKTEDEAKADDICANFASAEFSYRNIPPGGKGYVLCLSAVK